MEVKKVVVGHLGTNCYIIKKDNKILIIDPGDEAEKIITNIDADVAGILLTHNHFDHVGAVKELVTKFKAPVYSFDNLKKGENELNGLKFEVIFNPGHTKDSISFLFDNDLFCGDFIFLGSIGRTDIGGNNKDMINSITNILECSDDLNIYPGHGNKTTLKSERDNLLYFKSVL